MTVCFMLSLTSYYPFSLDPFFLPHISRYSIIVSSLVFLALMSINLGFHYQAGFAAIGICFLVGVANVAMYWTLDLITSADYFFSSELFYQYIWIFKLFLASEFFMFFVLFWTALDFRFSCEMFFASSVFICLDLVAFGIPLSNLFILLFSSFPSQAYSILVKRERISIN